MKSINATIKAKLSTSSEVTEELLSNVEVVIAESDTARLGNLGDKRSVRSSNCIYCGSTDQLSDEHVIPYAWGGTLQVYDGSCERCRLITSQFENFALNDGSMAHARKVHGIQSRSRHASAKKHVTVTLVCDGVERTVQLPSSEIPIMLGFPWFGRPSLITGSDLKQLSIEGLVTTSHGKDVQRFLKAHAASTMRFEESAKHVVALARTLAKIAYGYAWIDGIFDIIEGRDDLMNAFMGQPDNIGTFVGTKPPPFERYPGCQFRLEYKLWLPQLLLYLEVQPFADTPAPIYEVVLGRCANIRAWRKVRTRIASGFQSRLTSATKT